MMKLDTILKGFTLFGDEYDEAALLVKTIILQAQKELGDASLEEIEDLAVEKFIKTDLWKNRKIENEQEFALDLLTDKP